MVQIPDFSIYNKPPYLLAQFEGTNLVDILEAGDIQFNALEAAFWTLRNDMYLQTAMGIQLDVLGTILGLARNGKDDISYRTLLQVKALINTSAGTPETVIEVIRKIYNSTIIEYEHIYPAKVQIYADGDISVVSFFDFVLDTGDFLVLDDGSFLDGGILDNSVFDMVKSVLPAGVDVYLLSELALDDESILVADDGEHFVVTA